MGQKSHFFQKKLAFGEKKGPKTKRKKTKRKKG